MQTKYLAYALLIIAILFCALAFLIHETRQRNKIADLRLQVNSLNYQISSINSSISKLKSDFSFLKASINVVKKDWSPANFNYLAIGNSITLHGKNNYWWSECGMAASNKENDFVHVLAQKIKQDQHKNVDILPYNFSVWEVNAHDRSEFLSLLNSFLSENIDLITVQLGENIHDISTLTQDYLELISYLKEHAPKSKIVIVGDFWNFRNW